MRPTAIIFSELQCLLVPYINPAKHVPGVQIVHTLGAISFHSNEENFKKSSKTIKHVVQTGLMLMSFAPIDSW